MNTAILGLLCVLLGLGLGTVMKKEKVIVREVQKTVKRGPYKKRKKSSYSATANAIRLATSKMEKCDILSEAYEAKHGKPMKKSTAYYRLTNMSLRKALSTKVR